MNHLRIIVDAASLKVAELLSYLHGRFGRRVALVSAFGPESQVLVDMLVRNDCPMRVVTLDTGRLPQETYDLIDATRKRYGIAVEVVFPERADVERLAYLDGVNSFRDSVAQRKACCHARKVLPLRRILRQLDAWVTGLRREQSVTRQDVAVAEWDESNELIKINPLADWRAERVWEYIRLHDVPYNTLHDSGYASIGCTPCTRTVREGEDIRAGRWWWELPEHKECGLHVVDGQLTRKAR